MPEATGADMLQDIRDFHAWLGSPGCLTQHLPAGVLPDLDSILVMGESAEGWFALQSGLLPKCRWRTDANRCTLPMLVLAWWAWV